MSTVWSWILLFIVILLVANVILSGFVVFFERRNPASTWAWLLVLLFIPIFWIMAAAVLLVIYACALIYGIRIERRHRFRAAQLVRLSELSRRELVGRGAFFAVTGLLMWAALELSVGYALSGGGLLVCLYLWKRAGAAKGSGGA